ncbi:MAG: helix-turn-helix domain-containing protein [Pirellulales bacterium]|nr:helix-turn-helix domain-containing protein [Pirellulales bacterium]
MPVKQAAAILAVSYGSVLAAIHNGSLTAYEFGPNGGTYRIQRSDLFDYINSCRTTRKSHPKPKKTASTFKKLDHDRLLRAWEAKGIRPATTEEAG